MHPRLLPARSLNHDKALLGIPPDSVTVDNALVRVMIAATVLGWPRPGLADDDGLSPTDGLAKEAREHSRQLEQARDRDEAQRRELEDQQRVWEQAQEQAYQHQEHERQQQEQEHQQREQEYSRQREQEYQKGQAYRRGYDDAVR